MLQLEEHILDPKAGDFEPEKFKDRYENAVVEMLQRKRAGMSVQPNASPRQRRMSSA
jgi:DNA end-binding protein Ku